MCCKRPHGTGVKHAQFWCLILQPLTLHGMESVQNRLWSLPLVYIWVELKSFPAAGLTIQIWGRPRYGSLLEKIGTPHQNNSSPASFYPRSYPCCCTSGVTPLKEKGHRMVLTSSGQSLVVWRRSVQLPRVNYLIL